MLGLPPRPASPSVHVATPGVLPYVIRGSPAPNPLSVGARELGAARVLAIDSVPERLAMAQGFGAEPINREQQDPVEAVRQGRKSVLAESGRFRHFNRSVGAQALWQQAFIAGIAIMAAMLGSAASALPLCLRQARSACGVFPMLQAGAIPPAGTGCTGAKPGPACAALRHLCCAGKPPADAARTPFWRSWAAPPPFELPTSWCGPAAPSLPWGATRVRQTLQGSGRLFVQPAGCASPCACVGPGFAARTSTELTGCACSLAAEPAFPFSPVDAYNKNITLKSGRCSARWSPPPSGGSDGARSGTVACKQAFVDHEIVVCGYQGCAQVGWDAVSMALKLTKGPPLHRL